MTDRPSLPATWHIVRDDDFYPGTFTLCIHLGRDHSVEVTSYGCGGSMVTFDRSDGADEGFAGVGSFELGETERDVHAMLEAWIEQAVLAADPTR
jgi:hypothetical protein